MATIAKISRGANASSALNYALGKDKSMHEATEKWLEKQHLKRTTELENCRAVAVGGTNGVDPFIAPDQFKVIRELYDQEREINQVVRITQSFALNELSPENQSDWKKANDLGVELAEKLYPDHQTAVYTHLDGKNHVLHNHIIINTVNLETGNKLHEKRGDQVKKARAINDELAERENWHILEQPQERITETEIDLVGKKEYSYMSDLRERINQVMLDPTVNSFEAFQERLAQKEVVVTERGKNLSYAFLDANRKQRRARGQRLGQDFEKETIFNELENRARRTAIEPDQEIESREPTAIRIEQQTQQRESKIDEPLREVEQTEPQFERRKSIIQQIRAGIDRLRQALPNLRQKVEQRLTQHFNQSVERFKQRFNHDMEIKKQEKRQEIEKDLSERTKPMEQPQNHDRDRGGGLHL